MTTKSAKIFNSEGYYVARNFLSFPWIYYIYTHMLPGNSGDTQVPNTPSFYNDNVMKFIHERSLSKVEKITNINLLPTYCYMRIYKHGDILKPHTDREACEISVTLSLGYDSKPWPIWLEDKDGNDQEVSLEAGDGLVYLGRKRKHWRREFEGQRQSQVFLHYVDKYGPHQWAAGDVRR